MEKKHNISIKGKKTRLGNIEHAISSARFQEEKQKRLAQELPNELGSNEEIRARLEHEIASVEDEINSLYEGIRDLLPYSKT